MAIVFDILGVLAFVAVFGPAIWIERRRLIRMYRLLDPRDPRDHEPD